MANPIVTYPTKLQTEEKYKNSEAQKDENDNINLLGKLEK